MGIIFFFENHWANAQSFRYIDKAGNIFWVDSPEDIPPEYRNQVVKPSPTPALSMKQFRQAEAEKRRLEKQKEMEERIKQKKKHQQEKERLRRQKEKEKQLKQNGAEEAPGPSAAHQRTDMTHTTYQNPGTSRELEDQPEQEQ